MKEIPALEDVIRQVEYLEAHVEPELVLVRLDSITNAINTHLAFTVGSAPLEFLAVLRWVEAKRDEVTVALKGPWTISREAGLSPAEHRAIVASRSAHPDVWYRNDADLESLVSQLLDPLKSGDESPHNELVGVVRAHAASISTIEARLGYLKLVSSLIRTRSLPTEDGVAHPTLARVAITLESLIELARRGELPLESSGHSFQTPNLEAAETFMDWRELELVQVAGRSHRINADAVGFAAWAASTRGESISTEVLQWYSKGAKTEITRSTVDHHMKRLQTLLRETPRHASAIQTRLAVRLGLIPSE